MQWEPNPFGSGGIRVNVKKSKIGLYDCSALKKLYDCTVLRWRIGCWHQPVGCCSYPVDCWQKHAQVSLLHPASVTAWSPLAVADGRNRIGWVQQHFLTVCTTDDYRRYGRKPSVLVPHLSGTHCHTTVGYLTLSVVSGVLWKLNCLTLRTANVNTLPSPARHMRLWFACDMALYKYVLTDWLINENRIVAFGSFSVWTVTL